MPRRFRTPPAAASAWEWDRPPTGSWSGGTRSRSTSRSHGCARPSRSCVRCWRGSVVQAASSWRRPLTGRRPSTSRRCARRCSGPGGGRKIARLGGGVADGTFVNSLPISKVERVIAEIRAGEREAGKEEGGSDVGCRFFCIPQRGGEGLPVARWMFSAYATVPVYEAFFRWLGYGEAIDPMVEAWRAGERQAALDAAPEELIREIFVFGDGEAQKLRLGEFVAAGI